MSSSRIINVAVIGAGEIAMSTHLPTLNLLAHLYKVTAIVDVSRESLNHCARKFSISRTFTDVGEMLTTCPDVEMVLICHSDEFHCVHAVQCLQAGKDLFIEKPMAVTLREADEIEAARIASGKVVFVGHMRRYATAFLRFKKIVQDIDPAEVNYVRIRNFTSRVKDGIISQSGTYPVRFSDIPAEAAAQRREVVTQQFEELTGLNYNAPISQYIRNTKFQISPHDVSIMRELFGAPDRVIAAVPNSRGNFLTMLFQYKGFVLAYESGEDAVLSVDATIEVCTQHKRCKLTFNSPYIKGLPITATVLSRHPNGDFSEETIRPTYEDYYTLQFQELYRCLVEGAPVKTTVLDSKEDIALTSSILQALAKGYDAGN